MEGRGIVVPELVFVQKILQRINGRSHTELGDMVAGSRSCKATYFTSIVV